MNTYTTDNSPNSEKSPASEGAGENEDPGGLCEMMLDSGVGARPGAAGPAFFF